ncbi:MAG: hypothetical protein JWM11_2466 [Planctomycetaceae bacterium]|nr:hypothetical protein [Planctomycetaceae bacterium]
MFRFDCIRWSCLLVASFSIAASGCSGQTSEATRFGKTGKVSGTLKYAGAPVKDARIQFSSKENGVAVLGTVIGGEFEFEDPVPAGTYKVIVLTPEEPQPMDGVAYVPPKYLDIPLKYRDEFNSDLTATVKDGEDNHVSLEMKP